LTNVAIVTVNIIYRRKANKVLVQRRRKVRKRRKFGNGGKKHHVKMVSNGIHWNTRDHILLHYMNVYQMTFPSFMMASHTSYQKLLKRLLFIAVLN